MIFTPARKIFKYFYVPKPYQTYTLEKILEHAVNSTKYYSQFKGCNIQEFPFLTKKIVRKEFENLKSNDLYKRKHYINSSGGSTGEPTRLIQDQEFHVACKFVRYEQKEWIGYKFGDPMIVLWGNDEEFLQGTMGLKPKVINFLKNVTFLNTYRMGEADKLNEYIEIINRKKPSFILSYVQSIYNLAKFAKENKIKIHPVKTIMTSAGTLYPFIKQELEEAFGAKICNRYGSREVGNIASTGKGIDELKISVNNVYVEIIDEKGNLCPDGVEGEIVVTSLTNYAMPFIRYRIGDRGILNTTKYKYPVLENK